MGPDITFEQVGLQLSGVAILEGVNLRIASGEIHAVIGPNGGGKTSLIRCLLGEMPHTGRIEIDWRGERVTGYVPQYLDFDKTLPVSVDDFMQMVGGTRRPAFLGMPARTRAATDAVLERVGLEGKRRAKLGSLSGGERQRVLFAQALIPHPQLLVLDEPMTSVDEVGAEIFIGLMRALAEAGTTIVWIAHELGQVAKTATTVSCINRGVAFSGTPGDVLAGRDAETLFAGTGTGA